MAAVAGGGLVALAGVVAVAGVVENALVPVFIWSLGPTSDAYFVVLVMTAIFVVSFGVLTAFLRGMVKVLVMLDLSPRSSHQVMDWQEAFIVGGCGALNGILSIFASPPSRTPPILQTLLSNAVIPWTFLASLIILRRQTSLKEGLGAFMVLIGLVVSVIGAFVDRRSEMRQSLGQSPSDALTVVFWCCVYTLASAPIGAYNVIQERVFKKWRRDSEGIELLLSISETYFRICLVQLGCLGSLCWLEYFPSATGAATSKSGSTWEGFRTNFLCVFGGVQPGSMPNCNHTGVIVALLLFVLSYVLASLTTGYLLRKTSARFFTLVSALSTPLSTLWWSLLALAPHHGENGLPLVYSPNWSLTSTCTVLSLPLITVGVVVYRYAQANEEEEEGEVLVPISAREEASKSLPEQRNEKGGGTNEWSPLMTSIKDAESQGLLQMVDIQ